MKSLSGKLFFLLLVLVSTTLAIDPPVKLWEKWYYTSWDVAFFRDIEITLSGDLFIGCLIYDYTPPIRENFVALLIDQDGNVIWEVPHAYDGAQSYDGLVLSDGSYIVTGSATDYSSSSTIGLYIHKIASDGSTEWTKLYDYPDTKEAGYGITCLPDGGFAVCGRVNGTGSSTAGQAWLLRTDAYGDTLWTETWGTSIENYGKSILFNNDELVVLAKGEDDTLITQGTHLLFYDLDGNYLRGTDYPELLYILPGDMCQASDGGYTFVTEKYPSITHTDSYGEILWRYSIPVQPTDTRKGYCVRRTMDSGYIFSGWTGYWQWWADSEEFNAPVAEADTGSTEDGWLVKFNSEGDYLWHVQHETGTDNHFYSVVQLPQGGYITGGTWAGSGYLVRYAPETGIEVEEPLSSVTLDVSPNPFSASLSISCSIPEPALIELSIYDLSGRLVESLPCGSVSEGEHSLVWAPAVSVPAGCYMVRLSSPFGSFSERCVFLK